MSDAWTFAYQELRSGGPQTLDELTIHLPFDRFSVKGLLEWMASYGMVEPPETPDGKWQIKQQEAQP